MEGTKSNGDDLTLLHKAAMTAGEIGLKYFRSENEVWYKSGNSPVSQADHEIDDFLRNTLTKERPNYGWLSEETTDDDNRLECERVFIVDPIDGTRGFIDGKDEWCISIAIVEGDRPVYAVLHCPALGKTFLASRGNDLQIEGSRSTEQLASAKPKVTGSKKVIELFNQIEDCPFVTAPFIPSLAYRLALVAEGNLMGAFARPGASEWDVAAADLLLEASGCKLTDRQGRPLRYNQKNVKLPNLIAAKISDHDYLRSFANSTGILQ